MTHLQQRRTTALNVKDKVCKLLGWSEEQYGNYLLETGFAYIAHIVDGDQEIIGKLEVSLHFWNWFTNHWTHRDLEFIRSYEYAPADDEEEPELVYLEQNDARTLAIAIYPTGVVMKESLKDILEEFKSYS